MASYLITGCSRGLGLALAAKIVSKPESEVSTVFATGRRESEGLQELVKSSGGRVVFVQLDVTDKTSIADAVKTVESSLGDKGLDVLVNNAGIMNWTEGGIDKMTDLESSFAANVASAHNVTSAFIPLLSKGSMKMVANISTTLGSFGHKEKFALFPVPAYKVSKAALNMLTVQYAAAFKDQGFTIFSLSPGWLQTDLGTANAELPVATGSEAVANILFQAPKDGQEKANGQFYDIHVPGWENNPGLNQYPGGFAPW